MPSFAGSGTRSSYQKDVLSDQTINTSNFVFVDQDFSSQQEINIVISIGAITGGGTPSLQFTIADVDQGGGVFNADVIPAFTGPTIGYEFKHVAKTTRTKISWTLAGTTPEATGVYLSIFGALVTQATVTTLGHLTVDQGTAGTDPWPVTSVSERPATAVHSAVPASLTSVTILASNTNRRQAVIHNNSNRFMYVLFGSPASSAAFTTKIGPQGELEMPYPVYTGIITAAWSAGSGGDAQLTEITP